MRPLIGQCLAGITKACEAAGEVATAADYSEQAQHIFDELRLPVEPIIVSAPVVLTIVAPS
jgi:hypothetical protein